MRRNGCRQRKREALGELSADSDSRGGAFLLEGRAHREQREERERVRDRVGGERDRPPDAVEDAADRGPAMPTLAERACCTPTAAGSSAGGTTARVAPTELAPKNTSPVPSTKRDHGHDPEHRRRPRRRRRAHRATARAGRRPASMIRRRGQRSAATPATSPSSGLGRRRANETSPAFARRVREGEREQRIGDTCERAAGGGEELAGLEQDEVAVPAASVMPNS